MKPQFNWDGQSVGPRITRMPQLLTSFAFLLFNVGAPLGLVGAISGVAAFLGTGFGSLLLAAGAYGLNLLLQKKPAAPQPSDVQSNIRQEIAPRRKIYGRALVGSVIIFGFRRGEKSYILHYICEGPIQGFVSFRLDKKPVTLDVNGFVTDTQYQVGGRSRVQINTTLGTMADGPFAALIAAFPELDTPMAPFRHRGCVMALEIVEQVPASKLQDVYPNNMPSLQFVIDGYADVYDPDAETYGFSDNAGRCLLTEIMDVYGLTHESEDDINFASFADFADHCAAAVPLKAGGTEPRYRCGGAITLDGENEARVLAIASICNADVYMDPQGKIAVRPKMRSAPGIALRAKNGDHLDLQMEGGRGLQKQFNVAKVSYVEPALNYKSNEVRWASADLITEDGTEYPQSVPATLCPSATQAMRLGKLAVHEGNPDFAGSLVSGPQALDLLEDYVFTLDLSPEDVFERVACATSGVEYDGNAMTVSAPFVVFREGATDWNPAIDEQDQVIVPPDLPSQVGDVALDVTVTVELFNNASPYLFFSWDAASGTLPDSYSQQVEVSPTGEADWSAAAVTPDTNTAKFAPVADGGAYDRRIRNIASGKTFDWQYSTVPVTVEIDSVAPLALVSFTQTAPAPHLGNAVFQIVTPNDPHLVYVDLYRVASGVVFDPATAVRLARLQPGPGGTYVWTDGDATRANLFSNGDFASGSTGWTLQPGWTAGSGAASHATGFTNDIYQAVSLATGDVCRFGMRIISISGVVASRLAGGTTVQSTNGSASGTYLRKLTAVTGNVDAGVKASSTTTVTIDDLAIYKETAACAPQGFWDYYAVTRNVSGKPGPTSGPIPITIY